MSSVARHLVIHGHVQGVFYRNWMVTTARRLGITGWVRNRMDGMVEAFIEGSPDAVSDMLRLAHQGPPAAKVDQIMAEDSEGQGFSNFEKRPTE